MKVFVKEVTSQLSTDYRSFESFKECRNFRINPVKSSLLSYRTELLTYLPSSVNASRFPQNWRFC